MKHNNATPRPWTTFPLNSDICIMGADSKMITRLNLFSDKGAGVKSGAENAELIVRAVNAHDALVRALENAREFILRFDESTDEELEVSRAISKALALAGKKA